LTSVTSEEGGQHHKSPAHDQNDDRHLHVLVDRGFNAAFFNHGPYPKAQDNRPAELQQNDEQFVTIKIYLLNRGIL